ncbi:MAG: class I SAM-dependent methyltransferase [Burkholderiales bacterium]|jgi:SAM-dependent methyltransferase
MTVPVVPSATASAGIPTAASHAAVAGPSPFLARWLARVRPGGRVLDFASGSGRHARRAHGAGLRVLAVDRDPVALASLQGTGIETRQEDLEHGRWSFGAERFDAIVVANYLFRPRLDLLAPLLEPGGVWLYETFAVGNARYGRPSRPDFLLRPGELADAARRAGLHLLAFEDGFVASPRPARVQRAVAVRPPFDPEAFPLD